MFGNRRGLLTLENEELAPVEPVSTDEAVEVADAVNEDVQAAAEVNADVVALEEAEVEIDGIEELAEGVSDSIESGEGLAPETAEVVELAVEAAARRLGVKVNRRMSLESFKDGKSRLAATRLSLEGIKETVVNAWKALLNFFKQIYQKVKDFLAKLMTNLPKLRKQVIAMRDRATGTKGVEKKEAKIKAGAAQFRDGGKAGLDAAKKILANYAGLLKSIPAVFGSLGTSVASVIPAVKGSKGVNLSKLSDDALGKVAGVSQESISETMKDSSLKIEGQGYGPLLNGDSLFFGKAWPKETKKGNIEEAAELYYAMIPAKETAPSDIEALTPKQVVELADAALAVLDSADALERDKAKIDATLSAAVKAAEEAIKFAQTALSDDAGASEQRADLSTARSWLSKAAGVANRLVTMGPALGAQSVKAALAYGNASLGNIKTA